jgi:very-long-chain (3R)-3-hydroxyacyl-CoA dehydratase
VFQTDWSKYIDEEELREIDENQAKFDEGKDEQPQKAAKKPQQQPPRKQQKQQQKQQPSTAKATKSGVVNCVRHTLLSVYLGLFTVVLSLGWFIVLGRVAAAVCCNVTGVDASSLFGRRFSAFASGTLVATLEATAQACSAAVMLLQMLGSLEVVHALCGFVKGNWIAAVRLHGGRNLGLYCLVCFPELQSHWAAAALFGVWATGECCRYPMYLFALLGARAPRVWVVLRYSLFMVLMPLGFGAEIALLWAASERLEHRAVALPGTAIEVNGAKLVHVYILFAYVVGAPLLYWTMLKQRWRKLGALKVSEIARAAAAAEKKQQKQK